MHIIKSLKDTGKCKNKNYKCTLPPKNAYNITIQN